MESIDPGLFALSTAFKALGRILVCLGRDFRVVHASGLVDQLLGDGAAAGMLGRTAGEVLGEDLFGPKGAIREALEAGERREGWRAFLRGPDGDSHLVSVTAAPIEHEPGDPCDPTVAFIVVVRPATSDAIASTHGPISYANLVARSQAMQKIFELVDGLRHSEATVLLTGESGTGKEVVARAIHKSSPRRDGPFVAVNCGALPRELLESELFGHVRGAFTGAVRDRSGRFELAEDGTLFLDEIGDVPLPLQVKLLRVLQEQTFERVGESRTRTSNARIIAATNADLRRAVSEGTVRDDLYYRLRVVPIELPPLRQRREDIEPLAEVLLARIGRRRDRLLRLSPAAMHRLLLHDWPGNVRELENALEYSVAICRGQTILPEHLPAELVDERLIAPTEASPDSDADHRPSTAGTESESIETATLRRILDDHQWRRDAAAKALGISRTTLWRRMRESGLLDPSA